MRLLLNYPLLLLLSLDSSCLEELSGLFLLELSSALLSIEWSSFFVKLFFIVLD